MAALVAAAKKEGTLNVIALPPDWANYGEVIKGFQAKYGLKVYSAQPDASSADEITAAKNLKGQSKAPDVFDLSGPVANANTAMFAAYEVATFNDVPATLKDTNGLWVNDYGGYMSIGYDAGKVPAPTTVADLLKPAYKGKVALVGLGLPNQMREYVKDGTVKAFALWDPAKIGTAAVYAAKALVAGTITGKEGDTFTAGDLGTLKVGADNTVIVGPPTEFDANNIDKYNF